MELFSFWAINPADGQDGLPEPVKITFFENGDLTVVSISEEEEFRGAYRLPAGSYYYTGESIKVPEENLGRIVTLAQGDTDEGTFRSRIHTLGLINDQEWNMFYANPRAWKSLRIVVITFGE